MITPRFVPEERPPQVVGGTAQEVVALADYLTRAAGRREDQARQTSDVATQLIKRADQLEQAKYTPNTTKLYTSTTLTAATDSTIFLVDSSTGAVTIRLPPAEQVTNRLYEFKVATLSPSTVTILPSSGRIDLATSLVMTLPMQDRTLISDGVDWWIV